ncbi:MAG: glycosyltransferase [Candidatus Omnitrophica bacterium]|nr:glycosyltransferase [Candidatus Omnitrophota bacterium]
MSENNLVSFIIPAFNAAETIGACLESIKRVDYPKDSLEIIVVDNGSKDDTLDIVGRFTSNIFIDNAATIAKLRNIGAKNANGGFLIFLDSDCTIPADWVDNALGHFKDNSVGLIGAKTYMLPDDANWIDRIWKMHLNRAKSKESVKWIISRAIMVKKDIFLSIGGFNESLITCEDVEFGYRMQKQYKIIADERLAPLHLEAQKDIFEFFKKESWRGEDSLRVGLKHLNEPKEVLTIAVLFYYLLSLLLLLPAIFIAIITKNAIYPLMISFGVVLPLLLISFSACIREKSLAYFWKFFIIYSVYIIARIAAMFK